jgi:ABC-type molybdenum transport system ATPase subunit/photorepair protein PhrA
MLTRVYIDNFRCFSNFELTLGSRQLLLGDNGTGKSSVLDVIAGLQTLQWGDPLSESGLGGTTVTRWDRRTRQTFELDAQLPELPELKYRLELEISPHRGTTIVAHESLSSGGKPVFHYDGDTALLYESDAEPKRAYVDPRYSGLAMTPRRLEAQEQFQELMRRLVVLRPWPSGMAAASTEENYSLLRDGSNFSAWYRWHDPQLPFGAKQSLYQHLTNVLSGFRSLHFLKTGEKEKVLKTQWIADAGEHSPAFDLSFDELSDGQRMLVMLYTLLSLSSHGAPRTILLDEPTNFVSVAEIEPWLHEIEERCEEAKLQAIVVSHNPEMLDAWAGAHGIRFSRNAAGPVRAGRSVADPDDPLTPSERIARGWDDGNG